METASANPMDKYDLLEKIGEGTYGVVYKAKLKDSRDILAIKKISTWHR